MDSSTQKLLQELQSNPKSKSNNVVQLLATLVASQNEVVLRAVIQGLKVFFSDAGLEGKLQNSTTAAQESDAVQVYQAWLSRQYNAFTSALQTIATSQRYSPSVQVAAVSALMECVRAELGPGVISSRLYVRVLSALCTSPAVQPEVFSLLFARFFKYADLRYYTLWTVKALAARHTTAPVPAKSGNETASNGKAAVSQGRQNGNSSVQGQQPEQESEETAELGAASGQLLLPLPDLCRNLFDVLSNVPASLVDYGAGQQQGIGSTLSVDVSSLNTWCGIAEVGAVAAKADKNESARARRKRKAEEMQQQTSGSNAQQQQQQPHTQAVWANAKSQKRLYGEAWLGLLSLPIPPELLRKVLLTLHERVIPHMQHPALLADFLTHCLDTGGMTGMLALNSIFLLVAQHGLEYPAFYTRLYNLLTVDAFASKHRAQFFKLADVFLSSPLVPAYTVAACAKRLARLALRAPPAGALLAVAFIHNLIRRHPSCMVMLHNPATHAVHESGDTESGGKSRMTPPGTDRYLETEPDPAKSRAVESSLWEVEALRNHQCPHVATLCSVLDRDLADRVKTTEVDIAPLLITSYTTLFNQEANRRVKQVPIAFYAQPPTSLFGPHCAADVEGWQLPACASDNARTVDA